MCTRGCARYRSRTNPKEFRDNHFGARVPLADHSGDHRGELTAGGPGENTGDGAVWSLRGASAGPTTAGALSFGPSATGVS
ncbi:hypothetical protein ACIP5U_13815 [Streptomyces sp. NPDC088788]|uniref:hypothetical protein n=1 Tax=Streptomyces sp. NPDC088788 TaxID=3365898 RepID=UPI00381CBADA